MDSRQKLVVAGAVGIALGVVGSRLLSRCSQSTGCASSGATCRSKSGVGVALAACKDKKYSGCVYFDYNASTPVFPEVAEAMMPFLTSCFGNPTSPHVYGKPCREAINAARRHVQALIGAASENEIIFCSCGSEADNRAIDIGIHNFKAKTGGNQTPHIIASSVEHPAISKYLASLQKQGLAEISVVPVDREGRVNPEDVAAALRPNTALVTIMHSNNEVGTIQPVREISRIIREFNARNGAHVVLHSDAAQSIGKLLLDVNDLGVDILSVVGHKFGAPKGIGALYVRDGVETPSLLVGGGQEHGRRAGTENVVLIVGLGEACRIARAEARETTAHMLRMKQRLVDGIERELGVLGHDFVQFNGPNAALDFVLLETGISDLPELHSLPNTVSVSFKNVKSSRLMPLLADKVALSAGSACHSCHGVETMSAVLTAMQLQPEYGLGTLRISLGRHTTAVEVDTAVAAIASTVKTVQSQQH